jgi:hypothetical protein
MASSSGEGKGAGGAGYQYAPYGGSYYDEERRWWPWLVPTVLVACIVVFLVEMFVNDCPRHGSPLRGESCVAGFLHQFAFQPLRENPLLGPSSATYVTLLLLAACHLIRFPVAQLSLEIGGNFRSRSNPLKKVDLVKRVKLASLSLQGISFSAPGV